MDDISIISKDTIVSIYKDVLVYYRKVLIKDNTIYVEFPPERDLYRRLMESVRCADKKEYYLCKVCVF